MHPMLLALTCVLWIAASTQDAALAVRAQVPGTPAAALAETLRFDAVSIRRNTGSSGSMSTRPLPNGGYIMVNGSIRSMLSTAYAGTTVEAASLPGWVATERYDVTATSPVQGTATPEQRQAMMRTLLAERLNFKGHIETREAPAFDLVLARKDGRLGPDLQPSTSGVDCEARAAAQRAAMADSLASGTPSPFPRPDPGAPVAACSVRSGGNLIEGDAPIATMLLMIRMMAGQPVFDKTGLKGSYRIRLEAAPRRPPGLESATPGISDPPDIFTALPEQLGLKLEPSKTTVNVLIVDHIDRPTEN